MNPRAIIHIAAVLLIFLGFAMAICWGLSILSGDEWRAQIALAIGSATGLLAGLIMYMGSRGQVELNRKDGFAIAVLGWLATGLLGAIPYSLSGVMGGVGIVDSLFESISGFTTTGASVIADVESMPRGLLLWRAMTQWLGGMGVLVLCVAVLPLVGGSAMQLFQAEVPGPTKDRLTPRIAETAKALWGIYMLLTASETAILWLCGLSWFDALCHAFTTLSTGGFSTRNASVVAFQNPAAEITIIVFMLLGGTCFSLHFQALRGKAFNYFKDSEFKYYLTIFVFAGLLLTLNAFRLPNSTGTQVLREGFFQAASIMTATGFATADFNMWPPISALTLVLLMLIGGCAGSTAGGMKIARVIIAFKAAGREIRSFLQPQAVFIVKLGKTPQDNVKVANTVSFVILYVIVFVFASAVMCLIMHDLRTAFSSVATCMGNVGPGLGAVGPATTYAAVPAAGKIVLMACMLLGRLELYTVLVMLLPEFWKS